MLDFPLNTAIRSVFASNANFSTIDSVITQEGSNFTWKEDLVTFIDNHDMSRFLSANNNNNRLHQAMSFVLTSRGIPCIYYGTEQYLHNDTSGGTDPYNRPMMPGFDTTTTAYQLVNKLSTLRRNNTALAYGSMSQRWINNDVYIFERKFFGNVVLVAINKNETTGYSVSGLNTALPAGNYSDYMTGLLGGLPISVSAGSGGNNPVATFTLPAHTVSVWQFTEGAGTPQIGSIGPTVGPGRRKGDDRRPQFRIGYRHSQVWHHQRNHQLVVRQPKLSSRRRPSPTAITTSPSLIHRGRCRMAFSTRC